MRWLAAVAAAGTAALVAMHWPDVHRAAHAIPAWAFAGAVAPAGTLATLGASGAAGVGSALVLGIVVSATSICGVGVSVIVAGAAVLAERAHARRPLTSRA